MSRLIVSIALILLTAVVGRAQTSYVPHRVFDTARGTFTDFEVMLADLARADVVFVGEQHDDPNTHRLELMLAQGLARRRSSVIVSLEMFERDVQPSLVEWLGGRMNDEAFLAGSRPWPRYNTDYRPIVEFAREKGWPVVAANVPRPLATEVSKSGLEVLRSRSDAEKAWFAADLKCPTDDDYFRRFTAAMGGHGTTGAADDRTVAAERQTLERFYQAQCLKDETMAESIARASQHAAAAAASPLVIHYNGAFHSDFTLGTAERAIRRLPGKRVVVVTILPVGSDALDSAAPTTEDRKRAGYLIYTVRGA
jgi:uncharacterized iron-regulated protein